jgi:lysozyme
MKVSEEALKILESWEGFTPVLRLDVKGYAIGFGTHVDPERYKGKSITREEARKLMEEHISNVVEPALRRALQGVKVNQNQWDALVLWTYNVGTKAMEGSTLVRLLRQGKYQEAADEFLRWSNAGGRFSSGLYARRKRERAIFLRGLNGVA